MYRRLKQRNQLTHRGAPKLRRHTKPKELIASSPNQVWSWDITHIRSNIRGKSFYLYLIMDVFSRFIVGWTIEECESAQHSSKLIGKLCKLHNITEGQLTLHSDNGHPMRGSTMLETLKQLKVSVSRNRPGVCADNPYSESLFKTTKYNSAVIYPSCFNSMDEANRWMIEFTHWYNYEHLHSGINYVTPYQRHSSLDKEILRRRRCVYANARELQPARWSGGSRKWAYQENVVLNQDARRLTVQTENNRLAVNS